jgi:hypothetical protein
MLKKKIAPLEREKLQLTESLQNKTQSRMDQDSRDWGIKQNNGRGNNAMEGYRTKNGEE